MKGAIQCLSVRAIIYPSKTKLEQCWQQFMRGRGCNHSSNANMLPYIINRAEREGVAYCLNSYPGIGYYIKRVEPI